MEKPKDGIRTDNQCLCRIGRMVSWMGRVLIGMKTAKKRRGVREGRPSGLAKTWYQNGQKSGEINFDNGFFVSGRKWKPNGNPCPITNLKDGDGESVVYDDSGKGSKLSSLGWYKTR